MHAAEQPRRRFSVDEVLHMVEAGILHENEPLELLNGDLVIVSPQGPVHSTVTTLVRDRLMEAYRAGHLVREAKPLVAGAADLPEPDLAVVRGSARDFVDRHPAGNEAILVVEVARTSMTQDRAKVSIYARAGVPVYWLLDLNVRRLEVHTEPQTDGRYRVVTVLSEKESAELPGTSARVSVADLLP